MRVSLLFLSLLRWVKQKDHGHLLSSKDLRNYIQHQGLPVANYSRSFSPTLVRLNLTINAGKLCAEKNDPREWWYSKLNTGHGTFDFLRKTSRVLPSRHSRPTRFSRQM